MRLDNVEFLRGAGFSANLANRLLCGDWTVVPGSDYVASALSSAWCGWHGYPQGTWIQTDIRHVGDDPFWEFLPENGPDGAENRKINAVHRADYRRMAVLTREYGPHVYEPEEASEMALYNKVLRRMEDALPNWRSISVNGRCGVVRESGVRSYSVAVDWQEAPRGSEPLHSTGSM